ncbi:hypothetical protein PHMEG_00023366 [Phytophthora megakarya]|uniref:Uncharacterized protein n=1 Tax=Phytophthora megakarya TaxID=4795 RepID=A0A225VJJ7_9STRA|nr:hypothetical protein PHMEG_00023366 [Phytophthora megakarya]
MISGSHRVERLDKTPRQSKYETIAEVVRFAYLKPDVMGTPSFAYGEAVSDTSGDVMRVCRVSSGRWRDLDSSEMEVSSVDFNLREVTQEEATSSIGTYIRTNVCMSRTPQASARVWDYGVVVGYTWKENTAAGLLNVIFDGDAIDIPFDENTFVVLTLEVYALRPCQQIAVCNVMFREMRVTHDKVTDHLNGRGRNATRNSKTIRGAVSQGVLDEQETIPLFDVTTSCVLYVPISYILNFAYYSGRRRRIPAHISIGDSVFDGAVAPGGRYNFATCNSPEHGGT